VEKAIELACQRIHVDKFALLSGHGNGLGELFYLPIRVSNLLGWAGAAYHLKRISGDAFSVSGFQKLMEMIIDHYSLSVRTMSDNQAPAMACALTAAYDLKLLDQGETIASLLFNSACECQGHIAGNHIGLDKTLAYLLLRADRNLPSAPNLLARPSELMTVLLKAARLFALEDVFDEAMYEFDHLTLNAYVPDDYSQYGRKSITGGENFTFSVGHEIWTIEDLGSAWPQHARAAPRSPAIAAGAILGSLIFPDRVPWFLFA